MLCPNCRSIQPDGADYCSICAVNMRAYVSPPYGQSTAMYPPPPPPYQVTPAGMIKDYMSMSIISLVGNILFFNIFGIVFAVIAMVYADKVKTALMIGDYMSAQSSSGTAKVCSIIGLVCAGLMLLFWLIYILFFVVMMGAAMSL